MTSKTGNFKKFAVFIRMLSSALSRTSDVVFIDLLTSADLELLKARKSGAPSASSTSSATSNKRYLILTYMVEFDRLANAFAPATTANEPERQGALSLAAQV